MTIRKCEICKVGLRCEDERYHHFVSGLSPVHTLSVKIRANWCTRPDCVSTEITLIPTKTAKLASDESPFPATTGPVS